MSNIEDKFASYPDLLSQRLCAIRTLIHTIANTTKSVGIIEESLKWGQISFATVRPKSGTPIRIDGNEKDTSYSIFVPCSTGLIENFRTVHPDMFQYHGNREIRLDVNLPIPKPEFTLFLTAALTYYLD